MSGLEETSTAEEKSKHSPPGAVIQVSSKISAQPLDDDPVLRARLERKLAISSEILSKVLSSTPVMKEKTEKSSTRLMVSRLGETSILKEPSKKLPAGPAIHTSNSSEEHLPPKERAEVFQTALSVSGFENISISEENLKHSSAGAIIPASDPTERATHLEEKEKKLSEGPVKPDFESGVESPTSIPPCFSSVIRSAEATVLQENNVEGRGNKRLRIWMKSVNSLRSKTRYTFSKKAIDAENLKGL